MMLASSSLLTTTNSQLHQYHHIHHQATTNPSTSSSSSSALSECSSSPARPSSCSPLSSTNSETSSNNTQKNQQSDQQQMIQNQNSVASSYYTDLNGSNNQLVTENNLYSYNRNSASKKSSIQQNQNQQQLQQSSQQSAHRYHPYGSNFLPNRHTNPAYSSISEVKSLENSSFFSGTTGSGASAYMAPTSHYSIEAMMNQQQYQYEYDYSQTFGSYYPTGSNNINETQSQPAYASATIQYSNTNDLNQTVYVDPNSYYFNSNNTSTDFSTFKQNSSLLIANTSNQAFVPTNNYQSHIDSASNSNLYALNQQYYNQKYLTDEYNNDDIMKSDLVNSKKRQLSLADYDKYNMDSQSSLNTSSADSPLSSSMSPGSIESSCNITSPSNLVSSVNKTKKSFINNKNENPTDRQSRISAFNNSKALKKQKTNKLVNKKNDVQEKNKNSKSQKLKGDGFMDKFKSEPANTDANSDTYSSIKSESGIGESIVPGEEPKKRVSANKKERRRTQSINHAFDDLRNKIPEIPKDTKLSKIKTLKLATDYIEHLMILLQTNDPNTLLKPFKPDLGKLRREGRSREVKQEMDRKNKGRTGWPPDVWATEVKKKFNNNDNNSTNFSTNNSNNQQNSKFKQNTSKFSRNFDNNDKYTSKLDSYMTLPPNSPSTNLNYAFSNNTNRSALISSKISYYSNQNNLQNT